VTTALKNSPALWLQRCHTELLLSLFAMTVVLSGCMAPRQPDAVPPDMPAAFDTRTRAVEVATRMIGAPYRYGASGPASFDCSGLVQYSYGLAGIALPRTSKEQFGMAVPIRLTDAKPGDLLFFRYDGSVSHVGIYLGDLRFVHAPSSGKEVEVASLQNPHYQQHFLQAGRLR
jgi:cell wall-associated NlpC family hydrolase